MGRLRHGGHRHFVGPDARVPAHRSQLRRAVIASTVGTTIEWYDFLLYGIVTGLVFGKLFFPKSDPLVGVLEAFVIYAVGFIARPFGAAIFGHYGDRVGRKAVLIATLLITGFATFAVGLVPTYDSIGIWGAVILTTIRFIQGIGVGGEWGGSVLLSMEWARTNNNRGFIASCPQLGVPAGLLLAYSAVLIFSWLSGDQFLVWGWRIPFLLSIIMAGVGLYIRLGILETPIFRRLVAEKRIERAPVLEVIRRQPKEIILCALAKTAETAPAYIYLAFVFVYGTQVLHTSREFLLTGLIAACLLAFFAIPLSGYLSDRIGRKRMYLHRRGHHRRVRFRLFRHAELIGAGLDVSCGHAFLRAARHDLRAPGSLVCGVFHATPCAIVAVRSVFISLRSPVAGRRRLIATALLAWTGSGYAIAGYIAVTAIISIIATMLMPDYTNRDISQEHA